MSYSLVVEKDVSIPLRDWGIGCRRVFRPAEAGEFPVIMTLGPYPKDIHFSEWNPVAWEQVPERGPYMHWETVNPEWWVPHGYAVIRCDTRGTGKSPGAPRLLSRAEAEDFYDAVEWAGTQRWSNGKVAVMGISYFAMNAWRVAALQPPHLAAIVPWEGAVDLYRDAGRHGGIFSSGFFRMWGSHVRSHQTDGGAADPAPAPPELYGEMYARNPHLADIHVPLLSAGNWGGAGLHLRGNVEGYLGAGSRHKYLQVHVGDHVGPFYSLEGRLLQLRFLEQFLRGVDTGITREPPVRLAIRHDGERYRWRYEDEWPIARTGGPNCISTRRPAALATTQPAPRVRSPTTPTRRQRRRAPRSRPSPSSTTPRSPGPSSSGSGCHRAATTPTSSPSSASSTATAVRSPSRDRCPAAARWLRHTAGCAPRTASSIRRGRHPGGHSTRTTSCRSSSPARSFRSTSRSGRRASSSSAATGWSSRSAPRTTRRAPSSTTTRATARGRGRTRSTRAATFDSHLLLPIIPG